MASAAGLHFVAIANSTADNIRNLLRGLGIGENSWYHWEIQVVDWTARAEGEISIECDQVRIVAHGREQAVVAGNAVSIAHGDW